MKSFQRQVGEWGERTFPEGTPDSVVAHLRREVKELAESHDPEEAADCFILLLQHAHLGGYDLIIEAFKKFNINKGRKWGKPEDMRRALYQRIGNGYEEALDDAVKYLELGSVI